jgi:DNA-binding XRE family transcriptional regulator
LANKKQLVRRRRSAGLRGRRRGTQAERERLAAIREERDELAGIVASVLRGTREDADVKQEKMGYILGRGEDAISNMEICRTDIGIPDAIMWARGLGMEVEDVFEVIAFHVARFYKKRATRG